MQKYVHKQKREPNHRNCLFKGFSEKILALDIDQARKKIKIYLK